LNYKLLDIPQKYVCKYIKNSTKTAHFEKCEQLLEYQNLL
jgi:hypothetical protein